MIAYKILRAVPTSDRKSTAENFSLACPDSWEGARLILDEMDTFLTPASDKLILQNACIEIWPESWTSRNDLCWYTNKINLNIESLPNFIECPELGQYETYVSCDLSCQDDEYVKVELICGPNRPLVKLDTWHRFKAIATDYKLVAAQHISMSDDLYNDFIHTTLTITHKKDLTFTVTVSICASEMYTVQDGSITREFTYDPQTHIVAWQETREAICLPPPKEKMITIEYFPHGDGGFTATFEDELSGGFIEMDGMWEDTFFNYYTSISLKDIERLIL
jgi:hypothetical protein